MHTDLGRDLDSRPSILGDIVMNDQAKRWARARMAPETWARIQSGLSGARKSGAQSAHRLSQWVSVGTEHVTSARSARMEPWRLILSALLVLACALLLSPFDRPGEDAVPLLFLLACVGLATYMADWVGGVTALITSAFSLDFLFLGESRSFDAFRHPQAALALVVFALAGVIVVMSIERLKYDRANARLEAAALRAANTALSAVEITAARRPPGDQNAYLNVLSAILTAMVRVNRASAGALYLIDASTGSLVRAAVYGDDGSADVFDDHDALDIGIGSGLTGRVARERRPITVFDTLVEPDVEDVLATNPNIRSAVGVPLIDSADRLVGVAWVGLYVPYQFTMTAIARLTGLGNRTTAFMDAAQLADHQDELLDQVQFHYRRLQAVIQTIPEAVMVARPPRGIIVASNAAAQRMFGVRLDSPTDLRRADRLSVSGPNESVAENPMVSALRNGETVTGVELNVRQPDGIRVPVMASAAPVLDEDGGVDAVVGIFQDIGPLKEAERLRDEFISVVSHELRSPLTPIRGFAQIIANDLRKEGNHEQHVTWLESLQTHVDRTTRLVDDLLDVSRLRAGRLKILREPTSLTQICASVVDSWQTASNRHAITLEQANGEWGANVDSDRIHQVLDNLVGNAVKYANDGPITVSIGPGTLPGPVDSVTILVTDAGPGIKAIDRDAVFTPFYRTRSASESAVPGLGLGLFISSEIVREHEGTLTVTGTDEGGSRFMITLPALPAIEND